MTISLSIKRSWMKWSKYATGINTNFHWSCWTLKLWRAAWWRRTFTNNWRRRPTSFWGGTTVLLTSTGQGLRKTWTKSVTQGISVQMRYFCTRWLRARRRNFILRKILLVRILLWSKTSSSQLWLRRSWISKSLKPLKLKDRARQKRIRIP
jgi:hypothetical protein